MGFREFQIKGRSQLDAAPFHVALRCPFLSLYLFCAEDTGSSYLLSSLIPPPPPHRLKALADGEQKPRGIGLQIGAPLGQMICDDPALLFEVGPREAAEYVLCFLFVSCVCLCFGFVCLSHGFGYGLLVMFFVPSVLFAFRVFLVGFLGVKGPQGLRGTLETHHKTLECLLYKSPFLPFPFL